MNTGKALFLFSILISLLFLSACSSLTIGKGPKKTESVAIPQAGTIEWKERNWESYGKDRNGVDYLFERDSASYPARGIVRVWRKRIFSAKTTSHQEIASFDEFNCRSERFRTLELQATKWDGTLTEVYRKPGSWVTVYANTPDEYFLINLCPEAERRGGALSK
jgi:hypothetical protein